MKYDIIIIGAGLGGLECGQMLSKLGRSVLILEQEIQAGGCMQSYKRRGMAFDTGLHYVGGLSEGGVLHQPFRNLGLLDLPWKRLDPNGFDLVTIGDRTFRYAEGHQAFVEGLAEDFPHQREALQRYADLMRTTGEHCFDSLRPRDEVDFFTTTQFGTSCYDALHEMFDDELLINVLCGSSLKMELNRDALPIYTFAQGNNSFVQGSYRLQGDGQILVDCLARQIEANGGLIQCRCGVEELIEKDGRIVAARCTNGETYEADLFISNIHPALTVDLVKESQRMRKIYKNRIRRLANSYGMYTVSLAIKPGTLPYFNHNKYIYREANVWEYYKQSGPVSGILISCRVPEDGTEYTRCLDIITPMPWDRISQWADTRIGHRGKDYLAFKERIADECIALAETQIPGLRDCVDFMATSTPLTYRDYTGTPDGSAYGIRKDYHDPVMTLLPVKTPIDNLLLTGQNLTLHGLLGVTMTSLFTMAEIVGREQAYEYTQRDV